MSIGEVAWETSVLARPGHCAEWSAGPAIDPQVLLRAHPILAERHLVIPHLTALGASQYEPGVVPGIP